MGSACSRSSYDKIAPHGKKKKREERVADLDETMEDGTPFNSIFIGQGIMRQRCYAICPLK